MQSRKRHRLPGFRPCGAARSGRARWRGCGFETSEKACRRKATRSQSRQSWSKAPPRKRAYTYSRIQPWAVPCPAAAAPYEHIRPLPVSVLLENVRSLYNVGAFFRTADAAGIEKLYLAGHRIAARPDDFENGARARKKPSPGSISDAATALAALRRGGHEIAAIETSVHAVDLFDWQPRFPVCVIFGHETEASPGLRRRWRIPMCAFRCSGMKHSLNVATAGGVVLYELLRKYRCFDYLSTDRCG